MRKKVISSTCNEPHGHCMLTQSILTVAPLTMCRVLEVGSCELRSKVRGDDNKRQC